MFEFLSYVVDYFAPLFLIASPITSYLDQILSIHRSKSSDGFSLDIPLIMLSASILKIFYWFGSHYDTSLLVQACLTIIVQLILLKVALDNRPSVGVRGGVGHRPFAGVNGSATTGKIDASTATGPGTHTHTVMGVRGIAIPLQGGFQRPYDFWRWPGTKPYFLFLAYLTSALTFIQLILPFIAHTPTYISFLGYLGLAIEATLPIPQLIKNHQARSCKGFRLSVIVNWLAGDAMKMSYFFLSKQIVPWPFRLCGLFQATCDLGLGMQYWVYGDGTARGRAKGRFVELRDMGKG